LFGEDASADPFDRPEDTGLCHDQIADPKVFNADRTSICQNQSARQQTVSTARPLGRFLHHHGPGLPSFVSARLTADD
jgi:hypothetical protein